MDTLLSRERSSVKTSFPTSWEHVKSGEITVADAHKLKDEARQIKAEAIARYDRDKEVGRRQFVDGSRTGSGYRVQH